ncbi:imm11 family protein [Paenibacillus wenxiniae]|uniref:Imm11 family protein n=1 Tax=Paenibacillus wenxiniae TaxID=1636843 RepID=A0ABW4RFD3_9BACL
MTYYMLEFQYPPKGFISGGATFEPELDTYYDPFQTEVASDTIAEVILDSSVRNMNVDLFYTGTRALVVSDAFKRLLEEWNVTAQFVPTHVQYYNHVPVQATYWIVHRLQELDSVDYQQSDYAGKPLVLRSIATPPRRVAKGFQQIVLDESKIGANEFFTLAYTYTANPIISEALYQESKQRKLKLHATPVGEFKP